MRDRSVFLSERTSMIQLGWNVRRDWLIHYHAFEEKFEAGMRGRLAMDWPVNCLDGKLFGDVSLP